MCIEMNHWMCQVDIGHYMVSAIEADAECLIQGAICCMQRAPTSCMYGCALPAAKHLCKGRTLHLWTAQQLLPKAPSSVKSGGGCRHCCWAHVCISCCTAGEWECVVDVLECWRVMHRVCGAHTLVQFALSMGYKLVLGSPLAQMVSLCSGLSTHEHGNVWQVAGGCHANQNLVIGNSSMACRSEPLTLPPPHTSAVLPPYRLSQPGPAPPMCSMAPPGEMMYPRRVRLA